MEKWFYEWKQKYDQLKKTIENDGTFNETMYTELATECEDLLKTWMKMEDQLDDLKDMKEINAYKGVQSIHVDELFGPVYFQLELFQKAAEVLKFEISNTKHDELILYLYLGFSLLYEGKIDEGKEVFLFVVQTTHNHIEKHFAYVGLGCLYGRTHNYEEAIHYFEKANNLYENADIPYNIGMAYIMLEKYELAIPYLQRIVKANREDGEMLYFLGYCYLKTNHEANGFEAWYTAIQLLEYKDLLVSIAYQFEELGYYNAAIQCYKRLEALGYHENWVLHGIAWNYGLLEKKQEAIAIFEQLLENDEHDRNVWISYLWLLTKWNDRHRLSKFLRKLGEKDISHPLIDKIVEMNEK